MERRNQKYQGNWSVLKQKKKITLRCGLQCVHWILQQVSHLVTLEKAISKIRWGRNNEIN